MTGQKTIYVLGNLVEPMDNAAVRLLPKLKKKFPRINFLAFDPTEELPPDILKKELIIIDAVAGIDRVTKFEGLSHWRLSPKNTVHDFDLPLSLGILQKLGRLKNITVIGIPAEQKTKRVWRDLIQLLNAIGI